MPHIPTNPPQGKPSEPPPLLIKTIKAHIEKGDKAKDKSEQHYIAAGQHLKNLKENYSHDGWGGWENLLKTRIGLSKSRASELMLIASGVKTVAQVRADTAKRVAKHHAKNLSVSNGENLSDANASDSDANASHPLAPIEKHGDCDLGEANLLVDALSRSTPATRAGAVEILVKGSRQSEFEQARVAIADLYAAMAKAGH